MKYFRINRVFYFKVVLLFVILCLSGSNSLYSQGIPYKYLTEDKGIPADILHPLPGNDYEVMTDPPGFNWLPEDGSVGYVLEISDDNLFIMSQTLLEEARSMGKVGKGSILEEPVVLHRKNSWLIAGLGISLYRPGFTMGAGTWYWRWRCVFQDGSISPPSIKRKFIITEDAIHYPLKPLEHYLSKIPKEHPRVFIRPEGLQSFRDLLQTSEPHRKVWMRIKRKAEELYTLPLMEEPEPFPSRYLRPPLWRNYYNQAREMGQALDFMSFAYILTGEKKWADRVREWLLHVSTWDLKGTSSLGYNDEVAMPLVLNTTRAFDWIYDTLNDKDRSVILNMLTYRCTAMYRQLRDRPFEVRPYISHLVREINYLTQAALALYGEIEDAREWLAYLIDVTTTFYPPWGCRDGGYSEGPSYWRMYFNYMLQTDYALEVATGLQIHKKPFYRNAGYYKIYADPYFARQQPFFDTGVGNYDPADKLNTYRLATIFQNPHYRWRADSTPGKLQVDQTVIPTGILSYFWLDEGPGHIQAEAPNELPNSHLFRDIGFVGFHEDVTDPDETFMLLHSSPHGSWSHGYADQNSFYIQAFGEALVIQSGYYSQYGGPHHGGWVWNSKAHNTILVDGKGQKVRDRGAKGRIARFRQGSGMPGSIDYALADATVAYDGLLNRFFRHVYHIHPREFLMIDELEAPVPVRYDWLLHSLEEMEINPVSRTVIVKGDRARLEVKFIAPEELNFSKTDQFDPPVQTHLPTSRDRKEWPDQWHLTVSTKNKMKAATFVVTMKAWQE